MKFGLSPRRFDPRTIQFSAVTAPSPWTPPEFYSFDAEHPGAVPVPMYLNDVYGDCVIAARAHQTLRFEFLETGVTPNITDAEVKAEYFAESHGVDSGLVYLDSLKTWRRGWVAGGRVYTIHSFLEVQAQRHDEVREAMIVGTGLQFGIDMPLSASDDMNAGRPWSVHTGPRGERRSWGGHAVTGSAYDAEGITFETWGRRQKMLWSFVNAYVSECYLVIDDVNKVGADMADRVTSALEALE